jgi:predicted nucleotidyltransferase
MSIQTKPVRTVLERPGIPPGESLSCLTPRLDPTAAHNPAARADERGEGEWTVQRAAISDPRLAEVVKRLIDAYSPERIYLFGSAARGEAGPDSDYDLLLVVPDDAAPERKRSKLAYERLWGTGTAVDVLVWTKSSFDRRVHLPASLPATIIREGKLLHAA